MRFFPILPTSERRWLPVLLTLVMSSSLTGCNWKQKTKAAQVPQLISSVLSDPKTFNAVLSEESPNVFGLTYEGLIRENGLTGEVEPALAESWEISPDKKRIVFTLRQGLKWSDGEPLTADDVVFSYNDIYFNESIPTSARDILRIGKNRGLPKVRKLDDRRVEFTIPEPFAPFLRSTGLSIMPAHALRESVRAKDEKGNPRFLSTWGIDTKPEEIIVSGPYQLESYSTSQRVTFRRNPHYWRKDKEGNPQPYIERIIWQIMESTDTSLLQFRSGSLDTLGVSPESFSLLKREEKRNHFTIYNGGPDTGTTFIAFNLNKARNAGGKPLVDPVKSRWFHSLAFRQAVAYAIDRRTMSNNIYRGLGEPQNSPISAQSPYYLSPEEGLKVYDYNPEKAKELLLGAGFKYNSDGELLDAEGNPVSFTLLVTAGNKIREAIGAQIKQDLSQIGIQVHVNAIAFNTLVDKLTNSLDWECHLIRFIVGAEPNDGASLWVPEGRLHIFNQNRQPGQPQLIGWEVAPWEREIGELYIKAAGELDEGKRKAIYAESQRLTQEYLPVIPLINPLLVSATRNRIQGVKFSALGGMFWNVNELKISDQ
ncbi:ABC transporter substrate-binding protein [Kamptonema formosum]|uniref:ABC transporter substrate-binding protein n=1 Tax=Kamptonema formosum TaxID=331992 RepID=UPI000345D8D8|nr:ABC transporter substrate-binding protein [Oscillatoria sp. PCC 10802]